jgi:hypothetical protein
MTWTALSVGGEAWTPVTAAGAAWSGAGAGADFWLGEAEALRPRVTDDEGAFVVGDLNFFVVVD